MPDFWIDANCLIEPHRRWYAFDVVPGYWDFLENEFEDGRLASCALIYEELKRGNRDDLLDWATRQKEKGFFIDPDQAVMAFVGEIGGYVRSQFEEAQAREFMDGADPWLIAHARIHGGTIVTEEGQRRHTVKPKIPAVAKYFDLDDPISVLALLRHFRVKFR